MFSNLLRILNTSIKQYSQDITKQLHKRARDINIQPGDIVMVKLHTPLGNSNKISPKFKGSYKIVATDSENKFKIRHLETGDISVRHADELKQTNMNEFGAHTLMDSEETDNTETQTDEAQTGTDSAQTGTSNTASDNESNAYKMKLRSHRKQVLP